MQEVWLLKRRKIDEKAGSVDEQPPPRRLLIAAADDDQRDTYAALLATKGFETFRTELETAPTATANTLIGCTVLVGTGTQESAAIAQVDAMRNSHHQQTRRTATVLVASGYRNQLFAWETGVDGFVVMPAHLEEIVATVEEALARPRLARYEHRQEQLAAIRSA